MQYFDATTIAATLSFSELHEELDKAFAQEHEIPARQHYKIGERWGLDAHLLMMLAWGRERYLGIKMVTLHNDNPAQGLPALSGTYCLFDGKNGQVLAMFDGAELTAYRTAAASVLAATRLTARAPDTLLILGTGNLSRYFIRAYAEVMQPARILLWGRNRSKAEKVLERIDLTDVELAFADDLESAVRQANIISCLTSSTQPLFPGDWCQPGCHIDLVGGYRADMREVDDVLMQRAMIYVDSYQGALAEAGDIINPLSRGIISREDIRAELAEMQADWQFHPLAGKDLSVFKSVGSAIEDLAAAVLVYEKNRPV